MPTPEELFDLAVQAKGLGTRLPDDAAARSNPLLLSHQEFTNRQIDDFRRLWDPTGQHPTQRPVVLDYIDSTFAGAWAFTYNDQYFIAINHGLFLIIEFMFNSLLARREFLSNLGTINAERDNLPIIPIGINFNDIIASIDASGLTPADFIPRTKERWQVAQFLTNTAIRFLSAHEYRHIQAGHADYYDNNFTLKYIAEYISHGSVADIQMKRQAMEWDCDRFAIHKLLEMVWPTHLKALRNPLPFALFYQDARLLLFLCITACSGIFRLLDYEMPPRSEWNTLSHPPPRIRRHYLFNTAFTWCEHRFRNTFGNDTLTELVHKCIDNIDILLADQWGCHLDADYSRMVATEGAAYEQEIMQTWRDIMSDLEQYTYVPLETCPI
jgi:hypothetical protein